MEDKYYEFVRLKDKNTGKYIKDDESDFYTEEEAKKSLEIDLCIYGTIENIIVEKSIVCSYAEIPAKEFLKK
jgi:hypothetical protein